MRRPVIISTALGLFLILGAGPALACGGLVSPNGTVNLSRTTTLAGYRNGVEHYVTSFRFAGGGQGGEFGSIVPLPGVPTKVVRGGDWTLQRLLQEVQPPRRELAFATLDSAAGARSAEVLLETKIDALEITILKGGGDAVGVWAKDHGFFLTPDAPEVLDFYAARSPIFMAARFDAKAARDLGQGAGDGTPIHLTIPTDRPWVPLRILALGASGLAPVEADVFLLTDSDLPPSLLPNPVPGTGLGGFVRDLLPQERPGLVLETSQPASESLLADLRSDKGMKWIPKDLSGMWLSFLRLDTTARDLTYDLAIEPTGTSLPSPVDAGLADAGGSVAAGEPLRTVVIGLAALAVVLGGAWAVRRRGLRPAV
jgi:Uncharacterized protein conserved in bacteria (DUF2330)